MQKMNLILVIVLKSCVQLFWGRRTMFCHDITKAEDAVQLGVLKAWQELSKLRDISSFNAWVHSIVKNKAIGIWRHDHGVFQSKTSSMDEPVTSKTDSEDLIPLLPSEAPSQLRIVLHSERFQLAGQAINQLDPLSQKVLFLRGVEQKSTVETAEAVGLSVEAAKSMIVSCQNCL